MDSRHATRHVHAMEVARRALIAGGRISTAAFLSGLDRYTLRSYFLFDQHDAPKPGKRPDSPERFMKHATVFTMIDASMLYALYRDVRDHCVHPADALLAAYAQYVKRRIAIELSFDRAFYVVSWTDRLWAWAGREPVMRFTACDRCHCRYLSTSLAYDNHRRECPFCKLTARYRRDPRVLERFPAPAHGRDRDAATAVGAYAKGVSWLRHDSNTSPCPSLAYGLTALPSTPFSPIVCAKR